MSMELTVIELECSIVDDLPILFLDKHEVVRGHSDVDVIRVQSCLLVNIRGALGGSDASFGSKGTRSLFLDYFLQGGGDSIASVLVNFKATFGLHAVVKVVGIVLDRLFKLTSC